MRERALLHFKKPCLLKLKFFIFAINYMHFLLTIALSINIIKE